MTSDIGHFWSGSTFACGDINELLDAVSKRNDYHWIIIIDEVTIYHNLADFTRLKMQYSNVSLIMAISPNFPQNDEEQVIPIFPREDENTIIEHLKGTYRNSLEIAIFLIHVNVKIGPMETLSIKDNMPIHQTCVASGYKPLWILASRQMSDEGILVAIRDELGPQSKDVVLLYGLPLNHETVKPIEKWCLMQGWTVVHCAKMIGSEASSVILFDTGKCGYYDEMIEWYTRAINRFFIVQRYHNTSFYTTVELEHIIYTVEPL